MRSPRRSLALAFGALLGAGLASGAGCGEDCCTVDSLPIPLARAPLGGGLPGDGALMAMARDPAGAAPAFSMVVDTASPITIVGGTPPAGTLTIGRRAFNLLDASLPDPAPVRAEFRGIGVFTLPLGPVGDASAVPGGILGGDLLRAFSVELRFAPPSSITFWRHLGASLGILEDAGFAVLRFNLFGGGETTAQTEPDIFGLRAPVDLAATRVVLRACAAPAAFAPTVPPPACCTRGTEVSLSTGVDLALMVATGVGPLVLGRSAWNRVAATLATAPVMSSAPLLMATWPKSGRPGPAGELPVAAQWTTLPRLALVDLEAGTANDPGPCVELGRARRLEWVAGQQAAAWEAHRLGTGPDTSACVQPCDTDPRETDKAQNSAAYLELGGAIPVAIVEDDEPFLQALRFDVRPEGPEVDGLVGAGVLSATRLELDYLSEPPRAVFSCDASATVDVCKAASRCPRLPDRSYKHLCFGLPAHGLPESCLPSGC